MSSIYMSSNSSHRSRGASGDVAERHRPILVVADHALTGELVQSLVEVAGHRPLVPSPGERVVDAVTRVHPDLVLIDLAHQEATEDALYERAQSEGSRLVLFTSSGDPRELDRAGVRRGVATCVLPIPHREFTALLARVLER